MLVYVVPQTGQALMNGSGEDFIAICTWLGIIQATCHLLSENKKPSELPANQETFVLKPEAEIATE